MQIYVVAHKLTQQIHTSKIIEIMCNHQTLRYDPSPVLLGISLDTRAGCLVFTKEAKKKRP